MKKIKLLLILIVLLAVITFVVQTAPRKAQNTNEKVPAQVSTQGIETPSPTPSSAIVEETCKPYHYSDLGDTFTTSSAGGLIFYSNTSYGFWLSYPSSDEATTTFDSGYIMRDTWRSFAHSCVDYSGDYKWYHSGKNILQLTLRNQNFDVKGEGSYYFLSELRIGASDEPTEVANCLVPGEAELATSTTATINGIKYSVFEGGDNALIHRLQYVSYRIVHNNMCYAIEMVSTWQAYEHNDWLKADRQKFEEILKTFKFTK
jgi:hypothetical protein